MRRSPVLGQQPAARPPWAMHQRGPALLRGGDGVLPNRGVPAVVLLHETALMGAAEPGDVVFDVDGRGCWLRTALAVALLLLGFVLRVRSVSTPGRTEGDMKRACSDAEEKVK
jgi:hypothetical protein